MYTFIHMGEIFKMIKYFNKNALLGVMVSSFKVTGNFKVTGTPWSHTARIREVPLYIEF